MQGRLMVPYGPSAEQGFESFIDQVMLDTGVDRKTARAEIQQVLGLSKWVREAELYGLVRDLFKDQRVLREASPEWLGRLRLDIYLPELKLAIEHQGEQHYRPIAAFGGEGYARLTARGPPVTLWGGRPEAERCTTLTPPR